VALGLYVRQVVPSLAPGSGILVDGVIGGIRSIVLL